MRDFARSQQCGYLQGLLMRIQSNIQMCFEYGMIAMLDQSRWECAGSSRNFETKTVSCWSPCRKARRYAASVELTYGGAGYGLDYEAHAVGIVVP